ncbi:MAG: PAS domain-containing protein [Actinobacteria bacterium]|nr:PAS domain-containing protein [Actinomycetota bacterium]
MLTKPIAFDPIYDSHPFKGELVRNALWTVRLRWLGGAAIIAGALLAKFAGVIDQAAIFIGIGLTVLGYNILINRAMGSGRSRLTFQRAQKLWLVQILADVSSLTAIIYFCGGIESPVIIFYVFHVVCAGILLPRRLSYLIATLATVLLGSVGVLQAAVPTLYHPLALGFAGQYYRNWSFVGLELLAFGAAMHVAVYTTTAISKRLQATERQIIRARNLLNSIITSMSEVVMFLSPEGELQLWNPAAARWFCRDSSRQDPATASGVELPKRIRAYVERVKQASSVLPPQSFTLEVSADPSSPSRQFQTNISAVFDESRQHLGYVIVAEDITEQRHLEHDLRARNREIMGMSKTLQKNQREMAQREKMVAIGTMAAGVAHEIGNPLACLSAVVQMLNRRQRSAEDHRYLHTLQEQIDRIAKIVKQLVDFSRPAPSEWVIADLDDLIEQTLKMLRYSLRVRQSRIESIRNKNLPKVRIIPQQFQQILVNLLLNALDAVEGLEGEQVVRIERLAEDHCVKVLVKDGGCGMTQDQVRQALEPFYTTKSPGKGTGLGLAVCHRFIEFHQGRIQIDSAPDRGTVVTVSFPAPSQDTAE